MLDMFKVTWVKRLYRTVLVYTALLWVTKLYCRTEIKRLVGNGFRLLGERALTHTMLVRLSKSTCNRRKHYLASKARGLYSAAEGHLDKLATKSQALTP